MINRTQHYRLLNVVDASVVTASDRLLDQCQLVSIGFGHHCTRKLSEQETLAWYSKATPSKMRMGH